MRLLHGHDCAVEWGAGQRPGLCPYRGRFAVRWAGRKAEVKGAGGRTGVQGNQHSCTWVARKLKPGVSSYGGNGSAGLLRKAREHFESSQKARSHRPEDLARWTEETRPKDTLPPPLSPPLHTARSSTVLCQGRPAGARGDDR